MRPGRALLQRAGGDSLEELPRLPRPFHNVDMAGSTIDRSEVLRLLPRPSSFSGDHAEWTDWKFVFTSWCYAGLENAALMMPYAEVHPGEMALANFGAEGIALAQTLMGILVGVCRGRALRAIQGVEMSNGLEAWRVLNGMYQQDVPQRRMTMLLEVLNFNFMKYKQVTYLDMHWAHRRYNR